MAPGPSSPTSLLWAHQLKREHGFLLKRMQDIEASSERQAKRIKTAEAAAKSGSEHDIATLAKRIQALDQDGINARLTKLEDETRRKISSLEAESEATTLQVATMHKTAESQDDEKRKAFSKEKALLKRIGEIETGLKTYEQSLVQMGRRVNEDRLEEIRGQLNELVKQVEREGSEMKRLAESVTELERANEQLKKSNKQLAAELQKFADRPAVIAKVAETNASTGAEDPDENSAIEVAPRKARKKKPHRWSGGGADRDIIKSGAQLFDKPFLRQPPTKKSNANGEPADSEDGAATPRKLHLPPKAKEKFRPIPPHLRPKTPASQVNPKKSHKWSGGGTDKGIISSGKGGLEAAISSDNQNTARGATQTLCQPKKRIATPHWTIEEAMTQGRATRRAAQAQSTATAEGDSERVAKASVKTKLLEGRPTLEATILQKRRPGQNLFTLSSVVTSPQAPKSQHPDVPARPRRRILQDN